MKIEEITEELRGVSLNAKVVSIRQRESKSATGEGVYYYGLLGDETGTMPFTAWSFPSSIRQGDVVEVRNCSTRKYNDSLRIYVDSRSEVLLKPDEDMEVKRVYKIYKVKDITPKNPYIAVEGVVGENVEKTYEKDGQTRTVFYFTVSDETGSIRVSSFGRPIEEGSTVKIEGAKVSEYNGRYRLTIFDSTAVTPLNRAIETGSRVYNVADITTPVDSVSLTGIVVSLSDRSGLNRRCNNCRKILDDLKCPEHPDDGFFLDMFASFVLSDATAEIHATAGRGALVPFLGITEEELDPVKSNLTRRETFDRIRNGLTSLPLKLTGDVLLTQNGMNYRVRDISELQDEESKQLWTQMEGDME